MSKNQATPYRRITPIFIETNHGLDDFADRLLEEPQPPAAAGGWARIPLPLLSLPRQQCRVACLVAARQYNRGQQTAVKSLAATLGKSQSTVEKQLAGLKLLGWLTRINNHYAIRKEPFVDEDDSNALSPVTVTGTAFDHTALASQLRAASSEDFAIANTLFAAIKAERDQVVIGTVDYQNLDGSHPTESAIDAMSTSDISAADDDIPRRDDGTLVYEVTPDDISSFNFLNPTWGKAKPGFSPAWVASHRAEATQAFFDLKANERAVTTLSPQNEPLSVTSQGAASAADTNEDFEAEFGL